MDDKALLKLCLFCSVLGLVILFVGVQYVEARVVPIGEIGEGNEGTLVSVEGRVYSRYYNGEHLFFTLKDGKDKIKIVVFENTIKRLNLEPEEIRNNRKVSVEGKVEKYKGELEILPERIYLE